MTPAKRPFRILVIEDNSTDVAMIKEGHNGATAMFAHSKLAFSLALVLATASAALAGPRHAAPQQPTIQQQVPAGAHLNPVVSLADAFFGRGKAFWL